MPAASCVHRPSAQPTHPVLPMLGPPTHSLPHRGDQHDSGMVEYFLTENLLGHFNQVGACLPACLCGGCGRVVVRDGALLSDSWVTSTRWAPRSA